MKLSVNLWYLTAANLGFNFRGYEMSRIREYKWNWGFGWGGGGRSVPQKPMHSELFAA